MSEEKVTHQRIITLEGDAKWINITLHNSLPDGINKGPFGNGRSITVKTIQGEPTDFLDALDRKPEKRYEQEEN